MNDGCDVPYSSISARVAGISASLNRFFPVKKLVEVALGSVSRSRRLGVM